MGLYRSLVENDKLFVAEKIEVKEYAHKVFKKPFDFLQLKDQKTFVDVTTLGQELTIADERHIWQQHRLYRQKILKDKRIKHRNFGNYSKHDCGYEDCYLNGVMIKQRSFIAESHMWFETDKNRLASKFKARKRKAERKIKKQIAETNLNS